MESITLLINPEMFYTEYVLGPYSWHYIIISNNYIWDSVQHNPSSGTFAKKINACIEMYSVPRAPQKIVQFPMHLNHLIEELSSSQNHPPKIENLKIKRENDYVGHCHVKLAKLYCRN